MKQEVGVNLGASFSVFNNFGICQLGRTIDHVAINWPKIMIFYRNVPNLECCMKQKIKSSNVAIVGDYCILKKYVRKKERMERRFLKPTSP